MMMVLLAAAAAAQSPLSADPDLHCMAAYLVAAGNAKDDATISAEDRAGLQSIVMYFFGKLDARRPGADLRSELTRLVDAQNYLDDYRADIRRCSTEAEARGKYLQSFGEAPQAAPATP
jgi:hypothetical protein